MEATDRMESPGSVGKSVLAGLGSPPTILLLYDVGCDAHYSLGLSS